MSFHEQLEQWCKNVLIDDNYYNTNIGDKFFVRESHIYYSKPKKIITTKNDKWRELASERMTGDNNIAKRADVRAKISEKKKGEKHHFFGKTLTEDHKTALKTGFDKKLKETKERGGSFGRPIGTKISEEGRKNMSLAAAKREAAKRKLRET